MVAFGIFGLLFLVGLLVLFPFAGAQSDEKGVKHFSFVVPGILAIHMLAAIVFVLLGIVLLAGLEKTPSSLARPD
jgi:hypothetical protein